MIKKVRKVTRIADADHSLCQRWKAKRNRRDSSPDANEESES